MGREIEHYGEYKAADPNGDAAIFQQRYARKSNIGDRGTTTHIEQDGVK